MDISKYVSAELEVLLSEIKNAKGQDRLKELRLIRDLGGSRKNRAKNFE
jgi:hypothetical protein